MTEASRLVTRREVQMALGVDEAFLVALEAERIVECESDGRYAPAVVERIRVCQTLHQELGVNFPGLEVALRLLDTIHAERAQFHEVLRWLKVRLEDDVAHGDQG